MVSVVNGYTCFSSCDEARAKQGKDPHPSETEKSGTAGADKKSAFDGQPAVTLDGALKALANAISKDAAENGGSGTGRQQSVDILA